MSDVNTLLDRVRKSPPTQIALKVVAQNVELISFIANSNTSVENKVFKLMLETALLAYSAGLEWATNKAKKVFEEEFNNREGLSTNKDTSDAQEVAPSRDATESGTNSHLETTTPWSFGPVPEIWEDPPVLTSTIDREVNNEQGAPQSEERTLPRGEK